MNGNGQRGGSGAALPVADRIGENLIDLRPGGQRLRGGQAIVEPIGIAAIGIQRQRAVQTLQRLARVARAGRIRHAGDRQGIAIWVAVIGEHTARGFGRARLGGIATRSDARLDHRRCHIICGDRRAVGRGGIATATTTGQTTGRQQAQKPRHPGKSKGRGRQAALDLGNVKAGPGAGILPPPGHLIAIDKDDIAALFTDDDEEILDHDAGAIGQDQHQIIADPIKARHLFGTEIKSDDRGFQKQQSISPCEIRNFTVRLKGDLAVHFRHLSKGQRIGTEVIHSRPSAGDLTEF